MQKVTNIIMLVEIQMSMYYFCYGSLSCSQISMTSFSGTIYAWGTTSLYNSVIYTPSDINISSTLTIIMWILQMGMIMICLV